MGDNFEQYKCSVCGHVPNIYDIKIGGYDRNDCDCGQQDVCDLCLHYHPKKDKNICPVCSDDIMVLGKYRERLNAIERGEVMDETANI